MQEQRSAQRHRTLKGGRIVFNSGRSTIDCTVRNLSDAGALLKVDSPLAIPDDFGLRIGAELSRSCHVVRRSSQGIGVAFTDAAAS